MLRATPVGLREHDRPLGEADDVSPIEPVSPSRPVTVIVAVPVLPAMVVTLLVPAVMVKSCIVKVTCAVCEMPLLVPVIVTEYAPADPEQDKLLVPDAPRVTLLGDTVHVRPVAGETVLDRETVPVNPRTLVTTMVELPVAPAFTVTVDAETSRVKSWTVTVTVAVCVSDPLMPVTDMP